MDLSNFNALVSLLVLIITWLIVQPLKISLTTLQISIDKLADTVERIRRDVETNNMETARVDEKAENALARIKTLENRFHNIENKC